MVTRAVLAAFAVALVIAGVEEERPRPVSSQAQRASWAEPGDATRVFVERVAAPYDGGRETWLLQPRRAPTADLGNLRPSAEARMVVSRHHHPRRQEDLLAERRDRIAGRPRRHHDDPGAGDASSLLSAPTRGAAPLLHPRQRDAVLGRPTACRVDECRLRRRIPLPVPPRGPASPIPTSTDDNTHLPGSGHRDSLSQRFAYDYGVHRWDGSKWNKLVDGGDSKKNEDYLIWDVPVRAMADGWVFSCQRNIDNNTPPTSARRAATTSSSFTRPRSSCSTPTSRRARFETTSAHAAASSSQPNPIRVKAGQIPRPRGQFWALHRSAPAHPRRHERPRRRPGRPLEFRNLRVRNAGTDWKGSPPCTQQARSPQSPRRRAGRGSSSIRSTARNLGEITRLRLARIPASQTCSGRLPHRGIGSAGSRGFDAGGKTYLNVSFRKRRPRT